jgi:phage-related protein
MATIATLGIDLIANTDRLTHGLQEAQNQTQGWAKGLVNSIQGVGTVALAGLGAAVTAAGGLSLALGKLAVNAAPVEMIGGAFEGLTASMEGGSDRMLAALQNASAGMVSNRDLMMTFNQAAGLVSKDFAQQLPEAMQYLTKVAASTGQGMDYMLTSLVRGVGRLSPLILDNLNVQASLSEATARASEMFGVEADALTKAQQQAGMMSVVMEKLKENTADMPDVTGSAMQGWEAFKATVQNVKDQVGLAMLPAFSNLTQGLMSLAELALPLVTGALERFGPLLEGVAQFIANFAAQLEQTSGVWEALAMAFEGTPFEHLQGGFIAVRDAIGGFLARVQEVLGPVAAWVGENVRLQDVLLALGVCIASVILPIVWSLITTTAPLVAAFVGVVAAAALLRRAWESNFLGVRDITRAVISFVSDFINDGLRFIRGLWDTHGEQTTSTVTNAFNTVRTVITTVIGAVQTVIQTALDTLRRWWGAHGESVKTIVSAAFGAVQSIISSIIGAISGFIQATLAGIQAFWSVHGDTIMAVAQNTWDTIKVIVETMLGNIGDIIDAVAAAIQGDWDTFGAELQSIWQRTWDAMGQILSNTWDSIKVIVSGIVDSIISFFSGTDWGAVGRAVIDGIAAGISNGVERIKNAARDAAKAAFEAAKAFLGISSPSRLFIEIGMAIGEGMILGIRRTEDNFTDAMHAFFERGTDLASAAGAFVGPLKDRASELEEEIEAVTEAMATDNNMWSFLDALTYRNRLQAEYAEIMERVTAFEKAQQDMQFLQQQMKMLEMIEEHGLDPAKVLGGLKLGLEASRSDLVGAMTRAMQMIVDAANAKLEIRSPSRVFERIGRQALAGMAKGLLDTRPLEDAATRMGGVSIAAAQRPLAAAVGAEVHNHYHLTANYRYQDEVSLRDDVRFLTLLGR